MARSAPRWLALAIGAGLAAWSGLGAPAFAFGDCVGSRCSQLRQLPPPHARAHRLQPCCCKAPPGWGWYRRQKFYRDCAAPLVVFDELGDRIFVSRNW
jgi:hypothetical protein